MNAPSANYDVIVLGGGISGLAIARECQRRKFNVLLLEKGLVGEGTSANSLRIIHGGFRYLQTLNIARVVQSLKDQYRVGVEFADFVRPLPCYLPLVKFGLKSKLPLYLASYLYRMLARIYSVAALPTQFFTSAEAAERLSLLDSNVPQGVFCWHDLQLMQPEALHQRLLKTLRTTGATVREECLVTEIRRQGDGFIVESLSEGVVHRHSAAVVVSALGPGANMLYPDGDSIPHHKIGFCRAFNLVFRDNPFGDFGFAIAADQKRQYFVVGRDQEIAIGTEYLPLNGTSAVSEDEKQTFLAALQERLPQLNLTSERIVRSEIGVLPILPDGQSPDHSLVGAARVYADRGFISLLSTKYTTFLSQAEAIVNLVDRALGRLGCHPK